MGKDDHLVGTKMFVTDLLKSPSHKLVVKPNPKKDAPGCTEAKPTRARQAMDKVKNLMKKEEKEEEPSHLEIDVSSLRLVSCSPQALEKIRKLPDSSSEALLAVSVYGIAPVGTRKTSEDTSILLIGTTHRREGAKEEDQRITKKAKIRVGVPVPDGVDRNMVSMIQNMHFLHPDLSLEKIADVMEVDSAIVKKVLAVKKLMPVYYNEMHYFFISNCNKDVVILELIGPAPKGVKVPHKDTKPVLASIEVPVKEVVESDKHTLTKTYMMTEPAKTEEDRPQDYEVAVKFRIWALEPAPAPNQS